MNNIFIISDTHFGHDNMYSFVGYKGHKVREYPNSAVADEVMITNWNKTVQPTDKVYHLGDVAMSKRHIVNIMPMLNGRKILIRGNHDREKLVTYSYFFKDVRGCHNLDNYLLTHVPIHPNSFSRFKMNIHGHTHSNCVMKEVYNPTYDVENLMDMRYYNACVEVNNYTPIPFDNIRKLTPS